MLHYKNTGTNREGGGEGRERLTDKQMIRQIDRSREANRQTDGGWGGGGVGKRGLRAVG